MKIQGTSETKIFRQSGKIGGVIEIVQELQSQADMKWYNWWWGTENNGFWKIKNKISLRGLRGLRVIKGD